MGRIILVVPQFPQLSETFIVSKFLGLLKRGLDIHIVCGHSLPSEWEHFPELKGNRAARARVHPGWPTRPHWLAALLLPFALLKSLFLNPKGIYRYLRGGYARFGFDILRRFYLDQDLINLRPALVHYEFGFMAAEQTHLKELLGCKLVASFRGHDLHFVGIDQPNYYTELWNQADAIHCLGNDLWRRAQARGCPESMLHFLIPPAVNPTRYQPASHNVEEIGSSERPLRILSVGRLHWSKGYPYALQAAELLRIRGLSLEFRIVGGGDELEEIAFCRHQLGLDDCVHLLGALPPEKILPQYQWADIFLHTAVQEGFCNAVLEAQAMGLPVVCSDNGGLPENVEDGKTGFVIPSRDPQAFADELIRLASDPSLRAAMGKAGRARVTSYFQAKDQITAFEEMYTQVLGK